MAENLVLILFLCLLLAYAFENRRALRDRARIEHVIYVNGTRGKSTVTRLIDAGLRAGGKRVFCKTTGTLPMTIATDGVERRIFRRGRANIREQLMILHLSAREEAQVLVAECMAVSPVLQKISQHRMVRADIGVITNARLDHTDEMGDTAEEICDSLCNTIPKSGVIYTADSLHFERIKTNAEQVGTKAILALPQSEQLGKIDFPENVELALEVCEHLGVSRDTALGGMSHYYRDPYALSIHRFESGAIFINGLSINDPQSSRSVYKDVLKKLSTKPKRLILLINNRPDRGYRTEHMLLLTQKLAPQEVWLLGASQQIMRRALSRGEDAPLIRCFKHASDISFWGLEVGCLVFAVGNIADEGHLLMERIRKESHPYVS